MARDNRRLCRTTAAVLVMVVIFLAAGTYVEFDRLKGDLLSAVSAGATSAVGQPVGIRDVSLHFPGRITIYGITIGDPPGFAAGRLLKINRITLDMKVGDLLSGELHFTKIAVDSPVITVFRDKKGDLNISGRLRQFFTGGSGARRYRIDTLRISSGFLSLNGDGKMSLSGIDLALQNLSSRVNAGTTIKGGLTYGGNRIRIDGLAYPGEGRFDANLRAKNFSPSLFANDLRRYSIDMGKAGLDIDVAAKRDTESGVEIVSEVRASGAHVVGLKRTGDIVVKSDCLLKPGNDSLVVRDLFIRAGEVSEARLKGVITDLKKNAAYSASLKISRFDLDAVDFLKGMRIAGTLTSGDLHMKGRKGGGLPEVSGSLFLRDAAISTDGFEAENIDSRVVLSSEGKFSFNAETTGEMLSAGSYSFKKPVRLRLSLQGKGKPNRMRISSSAVLVPVETTVRGSRFYAAEVRLDSTGLLKGMNFSGRGKVEISDPVLGGRSAGSVVIGSQVYLDKGTVRLEGLYVKNEHVTARVNSVKVGTSGSEPVRLIDIEGLTAAYPAGPAGITGCALSLELKQGKALSGSFGFSAGQLTYRNVAAADLEGSGRFGDNTFEADFRRINLFGGDVKGALKGRTGKVYFPLRVDMSAEKIDLSAMSNVLSKLVKMPYGLSGTIRAYFDGTINSMEDMTGRASFRAASLSASGRNDGRSLLKGADLSGQVVFAGKDLDFTSDAVVGKVAVHAKGGVRDFMGKGRELRISADLPLVRAADIRDSFWDIFPDSLLYAVLDGSLSASVSADFTNNSLSLDGGIGLKDFVLTGENGEYSVGPVNGTIPLTYRQDGKYPQGGLPAFEKSQFSGLRSYYQSWKAKEGFDVITAGSLSYGFRILDDIRVIVRPEKGFLNVGKVSANIFGGTIEGSAEIGFNGGLNYSAGLIVNGLSLRRLCDNIAPIKGYISGKVDGVADIRGSGGGLAALIGRADFWTYAAEDEKTMISREFLRKVAGPAVRSYIGDRPFDKGIMDLYIRKGFLIFKDLDISHRNFLGIRDLSIKVAPLNNRIRIKDLLWSITEAAQRAGKE